MLVARCVSIVLAALVFTTAAGATPNGRDGGTVTITPAPAFGPLALAPPAGSNWATIGGDYGQTRYSSLRRVTRANVRRLRLRWHIQLEGSGTGAKYRGEGTPLVYDGIMYAVTGADDVFAIDATNGTNGASRPVPPPVPVRPPPARQS